MFTYESIKTELENNKNNFLNTSRSANDIINYLVSLFDIYNKVLTVNQTYDFSLLGLFSNYCRFENLTFEKPQNIVTILKAISSKYKNGADIFKSSQFEKLIFYFDNCTFNQLSINQSLESPFLVAIQFNRCNIDKLLLSATNASYKYALFFINSDFNNLHLNGTGNSAIFPERIIFKKCKFKVDVLSLRNPVFENTLRFVSCKFYNSPKFHGSRFHVDTSFAKSKFLDTQSEDSVGDYRVLKILTHDISSDHDSMVFHALEMESRRNTQLPSFFKIWDSRCIETISSTIYKIINDYGRNFWQPLICLIILIELFALFYIFNDSISCHYSQLNKNDSWLTAFCASEQWGYRNIAYSIKQGLGPLGLIFENNLFDLQSRGVKFLSMSQFILSSIIWFLFIMQIRRQFKL